MRGRSRDPGSALRGCAQGIRGPGRAALAGKDLTFGPLHRCESAGAPYSLRPVRPPRRRRPRDAGFNPMSRDNIEALTMAIIMAVMLKYFIVEAYKIPTGSMQPTLLGNEDTGHLRPDHRRQALSYHFRDPERFEVAVFKYPLDRSKNFIKRICGMPGEHFMIRDGDLWTRPDDTSEWKVLRRPRPVQIEVWKRINPADPRYQAWKPIDGARTWTSRAARTIEARGDGSGAPADRRRRACVDSTATAIPTRWARCWRARASSRLESGRRSAHRGRRAGARRRASGSSSSCARASGATSSRSRVRRRRPMRAPRIDGRRSAAKRARARRTAPGREPGSCRAGKSVSFAAQNMDDMLQLEIDGDIVADARDPARARPGLLVHAARRRRRRRLRRRRDLPRHLLHERQRRAASSRSRPATT